MAQPSGPEPRLLVTGFRPFGEHDHNPTEAIINALLRPPLMIGGLRLTGAIFDVDAATIGPALRAAVARSRPLAIVGFGLAAGRAALSVERVATNVLDFALPDNAGARPRGGPIVPGGPDAYLATLPAPALTAAIRAAGVPARVSDTAGTYLCNQMLYLACHLAATSTPPDQPPPRCGFIHVPATPELVAGQHDLALGQEGWPTMALATMVTGARAALARVAQTMLREVPDDAV